MIFLAFSRFRGKKIATQIYFETLVQKSVFFLALINRPGVPGAFQQTPLLLIDSVTELVSQPFPLNFQNIINLKP